jgi:uncharacterized MAPEG superfamily protein
MTPELTVLALAVLLQGAYFAAYGYYAFVAERQLSLRWALSSRDEERPLTGRGARARRAEANFVHGLVLFAAAAAAVALSDQSTAFTAACARLFLISRVLYLPAYLLGWLPWRSVFWGVAYGATFLMALAALI